MTDPSLSQEMMFVFLCIYQVRPQNGQQETKQQQGTAVTANILGCCLVSFHFLWAILWPQPVAIYQPLSRVQKRSILPLVKEYVQYLRKMRLAMWVFCGIFCENHPSPSSLGYNLREPPFEAATTNGFCLLFSCRHRRIR